MKAILKPEIGQIYDDLECIGVINKRQITGNTANFYIMKCTKFGREKEMLSSTIRMHKGTTHKACGKGLKMNPNRTTSHHKQYKFKRL